MSLTRITPVSISGVAAGTISGVINPVPTSPYVALNRVSNTVHPWVAGLQGATWTTNSGKAPMGLRQVESELGLADKTVWKLVSAGLLSPLPIPEVTRVSADAVQVLTSAQRLTRTELAALGEETLIIRVGAAQWLDGGQVDPLGRPWWGYDATMSRVMTVASTISTWAVKGWAGPVITPAQVDIDDCAVGLTNPSVLMAALDQSEITRALVCVAGFVVEDVNITARLATGQSRTAFVGADLGPQQTSMVGRRLPETAFPGPVLPASQWGLRG